MPNNTENKMTSEIEKIVEAHFVPTGFTDVDGEGYIEYICKTVDGKSLYESIIDLIQQKREEYLDEFKEFMVSKETMENIDESWNMPQMTVGEFFAKLKQFKQQKKEVQE